jgi:hypothetical protein
MKSVYVDDILLHRKLKKLAQENGQTLLSLLDTFVQEGNERMEKNRYHPRLPVPDPVGMFGTARDFTQRLLHLPHVTLVETEVNAYEMALQTMERALLLPRDAYHWALMLTHGLSVIATTDADFTRISESMIYTCNGVARTRGSNGDRVSLIRPLIERLYELGTTLLAQR